MAQIWKVFRNMLYEIYYQQIMMTYIFIELQLSFSMLAPYLRDTICLSVWCDSFIYF